MWSLNFGSPAVVGGPDRSGRSVGRIQPDFVRIRLHGAELWPKNQNCSSRLLNSRVLKFEREDLSKKIYVILKRCVVDSFGGTRAVFCAALGVTVRKH